MRQLILAIVLIALLVVGLTVVAAEKVSAGDVSKAGKAEVVKGEYIIGFKNGLTTSTCSSMLDALHSAGISYKTLKSSKKLGFVVIKTDKSLDEIKKALKGCRYVRYVEPAHYVHATYVPNDPYFVNQWGPKDINATRAWDVTLGGSIIVAVIDTGIDYTHPDLAANYVSLGYDIVNNETTLSTTTDTERIALE